MEFRIYTIYPNLTICAIKPARKPPDASDYIWVDNVSFSGLYFNQVQARLSPGNIGSTLFIMSTYRQNPDMVARRIRGESILVPISSTMDALDSIISLNETAEFIRTKASEGLSAEAIGKAMMAEYEIDGDTAMADVQQVLAELQSIGALQPGDPS